MSSTAPPSTRRRPAAAFVALVALVALVFLAVACGGGSNSGPPNLGTISVRSTPVGLATTPPTKAPATTAGGPSTVAPPSPERDATWTSADLDGAVYARPVPFGDLLVVATGNNSLYGIDQASGSIVWGPTNLGAPSTLEHLRTLGVTPGCGNIDPLGITGTPAVDPATGLIYAVAQVQTATDPIPAHQLVVLDARTGKIDRPARSVDPAGVDRSVLQQRPALLLANGYVYIGFGGLAGDCGNYHGWLVAAPTDAALPIRYYQVAKNETGPGRGGAIWAPSGPVVGPDGTVYVATGNGFDSPTDPNYDRSNGVIALSPTLDELGFWAPTTWRDDNARDLDLGSTGPLLLPGGRIFQIGKQAKGFVLDSNRPGNRLGGIGGELASIALCPAFGGNAFAEPLIFVACEDGVQAVKVDLAAAPPVLKLVWRSAMASGPPTIDGTLVWSINPSTQLLVAFVKESGQVVTVVKAPGVNRFATPVALNQRVFVAAANRIIAVDSGG